jgi:hypothetical protein
VAQGPQSPLHSAPGTSWGHARTAQLSQMVHISKGSVIMICCARSSISRISIRLTILTITRGCRASNGWMINDVERVVAPRTLTQPSHEMFCMQARSRPYFVGPKMPSTVRRAFVLKQGCRVKNICINKHRSTEN